jgi:hypothetical protein
MLMRYMSRRASNCLNISPNYDKNVEIFLITKNIVAVAVTSIQWHYANIRLTFILQSRLQMFRNGCTSKRTLEPLNILGTDLNKAILFSSRSSSDFVTELNCNYYTSQKYIAQISFCFAFLPALIYHTPYFFGVPTWVLTNICGGDYP